jgi:NADH-quinone oxidoreductase subunit J
MSPAAINFAGVLAEQSPITEAVLFYAFAAMTGAAALTVVLSRNIVRMSVALLFALCGVAGIFFLLQAEFLAAVQLVVYAGGTLILIVFGIMLTNKSPFSRFEPKRGEVLIAIALAAVLLAALIMARPPNPADPRPIPADAAYPTGQLGMALLGDYLLPFELASVILLAVMIGAAYLAKARKDHEHHDEAAPSTKATNEPANEEIQV